MRTFTETTRKNVAAVLVGPMAIVPSILLMGVYSYLMAPDGESTDWSEVFNFFSVIGIFIAYILTVCIALPLVLILQKFGAFNLATVVAVALGIVGVFCLSSSGGFFMFLYFGYFALFVALTCWGVHKWV